MARRLGTIAFGEDEREAADEFVQALTTDSQTESVAETEGEDESGEEEQAPSRDQDSEDELIPAAQVLMLPPADHSGIESTMQNIFSLVHSGIDSFTSSYASSALGNEGVISQLKRRKFLVSKQVEESFRTCPRDVFVPDSQKAVSYDMSPLRLTEYEFNISAPDVYANALEVLEFKEGDRFLDIGSGCGQLTAMGAVLCGKTGSALGIDLSEKTVSFARSNVEKLKVESPRFVEKACDVEFMIANVFLLDVESLPSKDNDGRFDKIHCGASCPPSRLNALVALLRPGGSLVTPCGKVMLLTKKHMNGSTTQKNVAAVIYGPLIVPSDLEVIMHMYRLSIGKASRLEGHETMIEADLNGMVAVEEVRDLFMSHEGSDFTFVVEENGMEYKIPAHKAILSSRSGHFRALFNSNMKDCVCASTTPPEEYSKADLIECLRYMYTETANVKVENCVQLLRLSKFYDVSAGIFRLCEEVLYSSLDTSNAASILHLSNWYSCESLKNCTTQFILDNLDEVRRSEDWSHLDRDVVEDVLIESSKRNHMITHLINSFSQST
ncbi:hypothetical protein NDN08_001143 [Rhodosorus marinus]|uniref:protein-L-isoaspartate(D-aspartate) O-methyltransferase n=1 Tax=Rhodosorus marinus TaxID=101924 RepID=A0AAV8UPX7_9RHOD|nr:hypothetical protein NDN08_001143 [Rhodosorus marinus]